MHVLVYLSIFRRNKFKIMKVIKVIMNFVSIFAQLLITSCNSEISSAVLSMVPLVLQIEIWDFIFIFGLLGVKVGTHE